MNMNKKVTFIEKKDSRSVGKLWDLCSCLKGSQLIAKTGRRLILYGINAEIPIFR